MLRGSKNLIACICFLYLTISSFLFADPALAGAELPYSSGWYRNPALQNQNYPDNVFPAGKPIPIGFLNLLNPSNFPYEILNNDISSDLDFDLLSAYVQASNPNLLILNLPESPEEVFISISKEYIRITDETGNFIPLENLSGQGAFSVNQTSLIPKPLYSISTGWENVFIGIGLFEGTSGFTYSFENALASDSDQAEISPGDSLQLSGSISARAGIFEYINLITNPIRLTEGMNLSLAARLFCYQSLVSVEGSAAFDVTVAENYLFSDYSSEVDLFYYYPGKGYGLGVRMDLGSVLIAGNFTFGVSLLNIIGLDYSSGLRLAEDAYVADSVFNASFRPYVLGHFSYIFKTGEDITIIPLIDIGYGKSIFYHVAGSAFFKDVSIKAGIGFEDRVKTAFGIGFNIGSCIIESGIAVQQSVAGKTVAGIFLSTGLNK